MLNVGYMGLLEKEDLMIMRAIEQRFGTKSNHIGQIIRRFL